MSMPSTPLAELSAVTKRYGSIVALDGLDLRVDRGELLAVLGPNGAGKSTAVSLLLGLQRPDRGTAQLFGQPPHDPAARRRVGVMMQDVMLAPELKVREHLALVGSYYPEPLTPAEAMAATHIEALGDRLYGRLSGGQKRQVQFALAICGRPSLLFLDEPTVGLDVHAREDMWAALRHMVRGGCAIVLTTHYLEEAEMLADRVSVVSRGRIIASGSVAEVSAIVAQKKILCATTLQATAVAAWPDVSSAVNDGRRLQIATVDAEAVVRRLLAADPGLRELEVRRAGLAEAFSELTQEAQA